MDAKSQSILDLAKRFLIMRSAMARIVESDAEFLARVKLRMPD